ncbi:MAG: hypothetical protein C4K49_09595 [Candidatus Thorarchaeota archaeon]|nr:MAG: hypothetical protein C4K49_09595 [Candidatus Thorarchaeota archaeon]
MGGRKLPREPRYIALFILSVVLASAIYMGWSAERALGEVAVGDFQIVRANGRTVDFSVFKPRTQTYSGPLPAVLTIHGISASRDAMLPFNTELARRNFTVVSVDLAGHGVSSETFSFSTFLEVAKDAYEAVRYVQLSDPGTSNFTYGVLGHSLGAGVALLMQAMPVQPNATVIIGGGIGENFGGLSLPLNQTHPQNLMIACGLYDELVSPASAIESLKTATGLSDVNENTTYGSFLNGTARKLVLSNTDHLFEMSDPVIVTQSVDWMGRSLQGVHQLEQHTLSPSSHIYQYATIAVAIQSSSVLLAVLPLFLITYSILPLKLRPTRAQNDLPELSTRRSLESSFLIGVFAGVLFLSIMLMGLMLEFAGLALIPVSFGTTLTLYSIIMYFVVGFSVRWLLGRKPEHAGDDAGSDDRRKLALHDLSRSLVLLIPVIVWLFLWSWLSSSLAGIRLAATPQTTGAASLERAAYTGVLTLTLLPLFYADAVWLDGVAKVTSGWSSLFSLSKKCVGVIVYRLAGFGIVVGLLYIPFLAGAQLGFIMFVALLMLPFAVLFGFSALVTLWVGGLTKNLLAAALLNAFLLAMIVASTFEII